MLECKDFKQNFMDDTSSSNGISDEMQERLNQPLKHGGSMDPADGVFLASIVEKIANGTIKLYQPSSLLNASVYEQLEAPAQGKADFDAMNLLSTVREIYQLWQSGHRDSYQIEYLVHKIRLTKERLESIGGDIYII